MDSGLCASDGAITTNGNAPLYDPKDVAYAGSEADARQVGGQHYKDMPMQPWTVMQAVLTHDEFVGFLKGNIIRYAMRAGHKEGTDDAGKAEHYRQKLREVQGW